MAVLDVNTLLAVNFANVALTALALPFIMGRDLSTAARDARISMVLQGLGAMLLVVSGAGLGYWPARLLATLAIASFSASQWRMFYALQGWLGRRPLRNLMVALCALTPLSYFLSYDSFVLRTGVTNALVASQSLLLAWCCLFPSSGLDGRWRWVFLGGGLTLGVANGARAVLGGFFSDQFPSLVTPHPVNVAAMLAVNVAMVLLTVCVLVAWRSEAEAALKKLAVTDLLSGLLNRRGWGEYGAVAWARNHGQPEGLAVLALDLDFFKRINDSAGHSVGDAVIRAFARALSDTVRAGDVVARMGGEEFAVLMHGADEAAARALDQRLRQGLQAASIPGWPHAVSFSAGFAVRMPQDASLESVLGRADAALYEAKRLGRGRLELALPKVDT